MDFGQKGVDRWEVDLLLQASPLHYKIYIGAWSLIFFAGGQPGLALKLAQIQLVHLVDAKALKF